MEGPSSETYMTPTGNRITLDVLNSGRNQAGRHFSGSNIPNSQLKLKLLDQKGAD